MAKENMSSKNTWNESKLKELEDLWEQGHPISKIGEMLGEGYCCSSRRNDTNL